MNAVHMRGNLNQTEWRMNRHTHARTHARTHSLTHSLTRFQWVATQVLEFLGVEVDPSRLQCALSLADHPLVHRPKANFTVHDAFKSLPEQACAILRTIEQHEQGRVIMQLFGYGNTIRTAHACADTDPTDKYPGCVDMLTSEFRGAQSCKLEKN